MPQLQPGQAPPPDYYASNLDLLIDEVARRNADLLAPSECAFVDGWRAAGRPAQRLFARLLTRKGPWFRLDRLAYAEVADADAAVAELCDVGLLARTPAAAADALLNLFTRAELAELFPAVRGPSKSAWIEACVTRYPEDAIRRRLACRHPWVGVSVGDAFAVVSLLFFGSDRQDLTDFVLQDLGVLRFERYQVGAHTRPFATRAEVEQYLRCRRLAGLLADAGHHPDVAAAVRGRLWEAPASRTIARLRDRLLNRLGQLHERRGEFDEALECYGLCGMHPARERAARVLRRLGDEPGYLELAQAARREPWSAAEEDFALRACGGAGGRAGRDGLAITETPLEAGAAVQGMGAIERHALAWLTRAGGQGWHLENALPLGLAGLLFWEQIFAPVPGAFSHPMQPGPRDLFWPDFARVRAGAIAARAAELRAPDGFRRELLRTYRDKRGTANRLLDWAAWTPELVAALAAVQDPRGLVELACSTIGDLERLRTGFPDLTLIDPSGQIEFVEVKGPTDQLQPAQRTWLRKLQALGLRARLLKFRA